MTECATEHRCEVLEAGDSELQAQLFATENSDAMVALNSAMMTDGVVIEVADGAALTQPLHIVHIASGAEPAAIFTRSLLRIGRAASTTLVESYIAAESAKAYQVHDSLVISIGDGARLDHVRLIEDGRDAFNISSAVVTVGANACVLGPIVIGDGSASAPTSAAIGRMNEIDTLKEIDFPHSIGLLYSAFTYFTGFKVNSGEYKVMGLAPYGNPRRFVDQMMEFVSLKKDGTYTLPIFSHDHTPEERETHAGILRFLAQCFGPPRGPEEEITPFLAAVRARGCDYQVGTDMLFEQIPAYLEFFGFGTVTSDELRQVAQIHY